MGVDQSAQLACRTLGVNGVRDRAQDAYPTGAGGEHLAKVLCVDPTDRKERHGRVGGRVAHELQAHRGTPGLGRGGMDGTHADVVGTGGAGGRAIGARAGRDSVDLSRRMGREPDQHVRPDQLADLAHGHVVLSDVHYIGAGLTRDEGSVVDDEQRAVPLTELPCEARQRQQPLVVQGLLAQLHDVHAAGHRARQERGRIAPGGRAVAHEIQPRDGETGETFGVDVAGGHFR